MPDSHPQSRICRPGEYRFVLAFSAVALLVTSIPYALGAALATEDRVFGGFVYAVEDGYSYLAKMRQGAGGAWLFHIPYTPEPHRGTLFFPFHLLLGKVAALFPRPTGLTERMVWVYHGARVVCGLILLLMVYRFLAACTRRVAVRRIAWLMVTFGGGLGWLLVALGRPDWLGSVPLDFILPEGFTFLVLYGFPHIALARTLLLGGILSLMRAWKKRPAYTVQSPDHAPRITHHASHENLQWSTLAGFLWLAMGCIVPFYLAVAWAVMGAAWLALGWRERRWPWREGLLAGAVALVSALPAAYSAWVFTIDPVYAAWAAQNRILSPHPLHYLAAYGLPLALAAFAVRRAWREEGLAWVALAWVALVPALVYLPFNLQRRLVEGAQVPLSLLAALGMARICNLRAPLSGLRTTLAVTVTLVVLSLTNVVLVAGNCLALEGRPGPIYRDGGEVTALDWLSERAGSDDVVLAAYGTGNYLPARVGARAFVGHGPESVRADEKRASVAHFFDPATGDAWRRRLLAQYGVDYVFWGPAERALGGFDARGATYLRLIYEAGGYAVFEVEL